MSLAAPSDDGREAERDRRTAAPAAHERTFRRNLLIVIAVGVAALLALIATSVLLFERERDLAKWVDHTYGAQAQISTLSADLERIETARRGYLLVPAENFWRTFVQTRSVITPRLERFAAFTADNPREIGLVSTLRPLVASKFAQYDLTIVAAHAGRTKAALDAFLRQRDQHVTEKIRTVLGAMSEEEERLITLRNQRQSQASSWLLGVTIGTAALLILLATAVFVLVRRYATALDRSQSALHRLNLGLEDVVRERTAELMRANEEVQRFAYIVSHDLRSPLVNVLGFTGELEAALVPLKALLLAAQARAPDLVTPFARAAIEEDLPESIRFIRSSTQKMDRLISAILKLSREGRRVMTPEPLNMEALLQATVASMRQSIDARAAEVVIEPSLPDIVGDRVMLEQVFSNLLENAVKYLTPGRAGRITVRGRVCDAHLVYEVEDNGRGIEAKDHERVFELFRRAGSQDQAGEGIGLAHVKALVSRLGGRIEVESTLGRGSTFRLSLPRV